MAQIDAFFKLMNDEGASDLHMVAEQQPILRIRGDMERVKFKKMEDEELKTMLYEICPEDKIKIFEEKGDVDFGYEIPGLARYSPFRRIPHPNYGKVGGRDQTLSGPRRRPQLDDPKCCRNAKGY